MRSFIAATLIAAAAAAPNYGYGPVEAPPTYGGVSSVPPPPAKPTTSAYVPAPPPSKPVETPYKPVETPSKPSAPYVPVVPSKPVESKPATSSAPALTPYVPVVPSKPVESKPVESTKPVESKPTAPASQPPYVPVAPSMPASASKGHSAPCSTSSTITVTVAKPSGTAPPAQGTGYTPAKPTGPAAPYPKPSGTGYAPVVPKPSGTGVGVPPVQAFPGAASGLNAAGFVAGVGAFAALFL